jgi:alcohol dehydrogenase, propanol-preferring
LLGMRLHKTGLAETGVLILEDMPKPEPGPGEILLRVHACGVCHTDLHLVEGEIHPPFLPITPGHQAVGTIAALGSSVTSLEIGQRVGVPWLHSACGKCEFCLREEENLCPDARFTGFDANGGFAEWMVADSRYALHLPPALSDVDAAPLLCAGIIGFRSLRKADLEPGEKLGLVGFGASAHLALQVANFWSCRTYVFTRSQAHRQHAYELGAAWAGGIEDAIPENLDRAVLFAPSGALVPLTLAKLRPGGTLAVNAIHLSPIPEMAYELIYGERTLRSVANATYQDGVEFLQLAEQINLQVTVATFPLDQANQALVDLKHSRFNGEAVLLVR